MKILHCCLACFYIDDYGYQENLLPKFHKIAGHDVEILASTETFTNNMNLGYVQPSSYINEYGIKVTRIPYRKFIPRKINSKLRVYEGVYGYLEQSRPDIIFFHSPCSWELITVAQYVAKHRTVRLYVDGHEDFINSARGKFSKHVLHGLYYRFIVKKTLSSVTKYWGTLPARCDFLQEVYEVPKSKCELLVMGADDTEVKRAQREDLRRNVRKKFSCSDEDILLVTGGKFDKKKWQVELVIDAIQHLSVDAKLLIFGPLSSEIKNVVLDKIDEQQVFYVPWASVSEAYDYFSAADLVVFPSTHSVYWEQAAGLGKPLALKRWEGIDHIDKGGNVVYLEQDAKSNFREVLEFIVGSPGQLKKMAESAQKAAPAFLYSHIAAQSISADSTDESQCRNIQNPNNESSAI